MHNGKIGAGAAKPMRRATTTTCSRLGERSLSLPCELERATNAVTTSGRRSWGVMTSVSTGRRPGMATPCTTTRSARKRHSRQRAIITTTYSRLGERSSPLLRELERETNAAMTSGRRSWQLGSDNVGRHGASARDGHAVHDEEIGAGTATLAVRDLNDDALTTRRAFAAIAV